MSNKELISKSKDLLLKMQARRSVRMFGTDEIPAAVIENCIRIAATAPSGANMQPWTFVLISDKAVKRKIRLEAEEVEKKFYKEKITSEWKEKLNPLNVNFEKPFMEEAPYLICLFLQKYSFNAVGEKQKHYYPTESAGIATGMLISALHQLGLSTLTYTPAPMNFLSKILNRPENERPFMILPVGYSNLEYVPPPITKKTMDEYLLRV